MLRKDDRRTPGRGPWTAMGAGIELVVFALMGLSAGRWADGRFKTQPWLLLAGTLLGIGFGLYHFIRETTGAKGPRP